MAAQQIRSGISAIIDAIKSRLMEYLELPAARVFNVCRERVPHFQGELDILIRPGNFRSRQEFNDGAGRVATVLVRTVHVIPRVRLLLDPGNADDLFLTTADTGYWAIEEAVVNALQDYLPEDGLGNTLLGEPMRILGGDAPQKDHGQKATGWGAGRLDFELMYVLDVDQADQ